MKSTHPEGKYVLLDTETGGLYAKQHSVLTIYCAILDADLNILSEVDLKLRPNEGSFSVTPGALAVNKIDMRKHEEDPMTISYARAASIMEKLFKMHAPSNSNRLVPLGQNVKFDFDFIWEHIMPKEKWYRYIDTTIEDTYQIAKRLKASGKIPYAQKLQLGLLAKYLGIQYNVSDLHGAKGDSLLTLEVYKHLKALTK